MIGCGKVKCLPPHVVWQIFEEYLFFCLTSARLYILSPAGHARAKFTLGMYDSVKREYDGLLQKEIVESQNSYSERVDMM